MVANQQVNKILQRLEGYVKIKDYKGFDKFDALNSPFLETIFGKSPLLRLVVSQILNRTPFDLRKIFGVQKYRNPKGIANFIKGYCNLYISTHDKRFLKEAFELADWLLENDSRSKNIYFGNGISWGYQFPWQSPGFFAPRYHPNCIVSTFCGEAMLMLYQVSNEKKYLDAAIGVKDFLLKDLPILEESENKKCLGYVTSGPRWKVININSVVAGFLIKLSVELHDDLLMADCSRIINWVISEMEPDYSWNYTTPKSDSGIGPDNYHTGGILDGIFDYMQASRDFSKFEIYKKALAFYKESLFQNDFSPKWRTNKIYPIDIHGAAQGILTFIRAASLENKNENLDNAGKIYQWAIDNLWCQQEGRFYYQKRRFFTWKIDLMRWNNSWMFWAISEYYRALQSIK